MSNSAVARTFAWPRDATPTGIYTFVGDSCHPRSNPACLPSCLHGWPVSRRTGGAEGLTNGGQAPVHLAAYREHPPPACVRPDGRAEPGPACSRGTSLDRVMSSPSAVTTIGSHAVI